MSVTVEAAATLARFGPEGFGVVPLLETEHVRVLLAAFEPGQEIPLHAPEVDLVVTVVEGAGELYAGGRVRQLRAGDVAVVPAGEPRGLRARSTRLLVVNTVTPPPGKADHARLDAGAAWPDGNEDEP